MKAETQECGTERGTEVSTLYSKNQLHSLRAYAIPKETGRH